MKTRRSKVLHDTPAYPSQRHPSQRTRTRQQGFDQFWPTRISWLIVQDQPWRVLVTSRPRGHVGQPPAGQLTRRIGLGVYVTSLITGAPWSSDAMFRGER
ncbi:MAG: hypothetical protein RMM98_15220 [Acidobacteriota bacterium]|nr:hypothetical protein [Blastocatellia bacterium]MDW8240953.1 hypothetical protein [Acidobacteriota bacterium]